MGYQVGHFDSWCCSKVTVNQESGVILDGLALKQESIRERIWLLKLSKASFNPWNITDDLDESF